LLSPYFDEVTLKKYIGCFNKYSNIGMQAHYHCIIAHDIYDPPAKKALKKFLNQHNLPLIRHAFVGGSMFIVRAHLLKTIQALNIDLSDFPESTTQNGKHPTQLAHIIERFLGYTIYHQGYIISDGIISKKKQWLYNQKEYLSFLITPVVHLFYEKRATSSGKLLIRILRIPVFNKKR
jgi:hypothetical protein